MHPLDSIRREIARGLEYPNGSTSALRDSPSYHVGVLIGVLKSVGSEVDLLEAELDELLSEAAVEIANLDGRDNVVYQRLRAMQGRLSSRVADQPMRKFTPSESCVSFAPAQLVQKSG